MHGWKRTGLKRIAKVFGNSGVKNQGSTQLRGQIKNLRSQKESQNSFQSLHKRDNSMDDWEILHAFEKTIAWIQLSSHKIDSGFESW
jgi:hypothetical protein